MRIGAIGLGYVGLPLAVAFAEAGHEVVGVDTDRHAVPTPLTRNREPDLGSLMSAGASLAGVLQAGDVEEVVRSAPLVVDFRGVTRDIEAPNLVRL